MRAPRGLDLFRAAGGGSNLVRRTIANVLPLLVFVGRQDGGRDQHASQGLLSEFKIHLENSVVRTPQCFLWPGRGIFISHFPAEDIYEPR